MRKGLTLRSVVLMAIVAMLCAYVAWGISEQLFPQPQFTIDLSGCADQVVTVHTYHDGGTMFPAELTGGNSYACEIPQGYWKNAYRLEFAVDPERARVQSASINGREVDAIHIADYAQNADNAVVRMREPNARRTAVFLALFFLFLALCRVIRGEVTNSRYGTLRKALLCGGTALQGMGKKAFLCVLAGLALSLVITIGCDLNSIIGVMNLHGCRVDVYQYAAAIERRNEITYTLWPYNLPLLLFYFIGTLPNALVIPFYRMGAYHVGHYLVYKGLNGALIAGAVIGLLSFLEERGHLEREECENRFLWSFFNPLVFYVAAVFIQLDAFPMYCLALGCVLFADKQTPVLSGVLLGIGLSCKMQNLLFVPLMAILFLFFFVKDRAGEEKTATLKAALATAVTMGLALLPNLYGASALAASLSYIPQADRIWYTYIAYAPALMFLITPGVLVFAVITNLTRFDLTCTRDAVVMNSLYMFASVMLLFSFSLMSTPSTLIHCAAAFTLLNAMTKDPLRRLIIAGLSVLMVFEVMFHSAGDVLYLLYRHGFPTCFTVLDGKLAGVEKTRYDSLLFTVSHAAMLAFGLYFCRKAMNALKIKGHSTKRGLL